MFIKTNCPNCGGRVRLDENCEKGLCTNCGAELIFTNEVRKLNKAHDEEIQAALDRIYDLIFLKKYISAEKLIDEYLVEFPYSGKLYLAKLLCNLNVQSIEALSTVKKDFTKNPYYLRAIKFLSDSEKEYLMKVCSESH